MSTTPVPAPTNVIPWPGAERNTREGRQALRDLIPVAINTLRSDHSKRAYTRTMRNFIHSGLKLERHGVIEFLHRMAKRKRSPATLKQAIAALRKLAVEAENAGILSRKQLRGINRVPGPKRKGIRLGKWLTTEGARTLYHLPNRDTVDGKRDAAVFALCLGCGLRREEACEIEWDCYREINGRMCLVDFVGKGQKVRTVPVPEWARPDLDAWKAISGPGGELGPVTVSRGSVPERYYVLRRLVRGRMVGGPRAIGGKLTSQGVWWVVKVYAKRIGVEVAPHDLRRTLAQLMRRNGAAIEQIQYILGHEQIDTTMRYLGGSIELLPGKAAVDLVEL